VAQDYYDILQPFDYLVKLLDNNKATLGIRYVAEHDDNLVPEYPAVLVQTDRTVTEQHATGMFRKEFHIDLWVFHADMTVGTGTRSRQDIDLATQIRKLIHSKYTMDGHIIFGYIDGEFPGITTRVIRANVATIVTTRLTWMGENRVPYEAG
jgi:hypothetical protein